MAFKGAAERILHTVISWPDVASVPHRFGGTEFRFGKREIGHLHGDGLVDIPFPRDVRNDLVAAGLAQPHHILPESGWVSVYIRSSSDVDRAIDLLRRAYDLAKARLEKSHSQKES